MLKVDFPQELELTWHPTLNAAPTGNQQNPTRSSKVWWKCDKGHEWESRIKDRLRGSPCPYCAGLKAIPGETDLAAVNPELAAQWHPTLNGELTPSQILPYSNKKVWWKCEKEHEWEASVGNRSQGRNCPVCSNRKIIPGYNDLQTQYPKLVAQWHPTLNGELNPATIPSNYSKKVWWKCDKGHEWELSPNARRNRATKGCAVCAGQKVQLGETDLVSLKPHIAKLWHPTLNGLLTPEQFRPGSDQKVWWRCSNNHEWEDKINVLRVRDGKCLLCYKETHNLKTSNPLVAAQWHPIRNGELTPDEVKPRARKKAWWVCDKGHEWEAAIYSRNEVKSTLSRSCPQCNASSYVSKLENQLFKTIAEKEPGVRQSARDVIKGYELDIYSAEKKIAIEFNGLYWHSENWKKDKAYHYNKWLACKKLGIQLIQIWEDDWNKRPETIIKSLTHKLGSTDGNKQAARKLTVNNLTKFEAEGFLEENHIQGFASGTYYLGLKNELNLYAVLVLKKEADNVLNIVRYATSAQVQGGFTKLLKYAEKTYQPTKFITFSDNTVSDGGLYKKNGFTAAKQLPPDYMYVVKGERKHKFGYRLKKFKNDPNLLWEEGLTERELAQLNNLPRIWDAGKTKWEKVYSPA